MAKVPSAARRLVERAARVLALLLGLLTYAEWPGGRVAVGVATVAVAAAAWAGVRLLAAWAFGRIGRRPAPKRGRR